MIKMHFLALLVLNAYLNSSIVDCTILDKCRSLVLNHNITGHPPPFLPLPPSQLSHSL